MSKKRSLIKGVTKARENLMTAAQRRRARKTQEDLGSSARRDMKDSDRPSLDLPKARGKEADIVKVPAAAGAGLLATMAGAEGFNRLKKAKRDDAKKAGKATFKLGSAVYNTETGRKVETKANGGPVSKIKEKSVSDQVKLLNKSRSSAEKTEKKLRSMGDELDLIKKTKKQLEKDYGTKAKKPVEKANGGMATSRSRKPRGVGAALRGYGRALK